MSTPRCSYCGGDHRLSKCEKVPEELVEAQRRMLLAQINSRPRSREELEEAYGPVYTPSELSEHYEVLGFSAPVVVVRRRDDGEVGSFFFQHHPRFYFDYTPDNG